MCRGGRGHCPCLCMCVSARDARGREIWIFLESAERACPDVFLPSVYLCSAPSISSGRGGRGHQRMRSLWASSKQGMLLTCHFQMTKMHRKHFYESDIRVSCLCVWVKGYISKMTSNHIHRQSEVGSCDVNDGVDVSVSYCGLDKVEKSYMCGSPRSPKNVPSFCSFVLFYFF